MNLTDMIAQRSAMTTPAAESMTAAQAALLDQETGVPAAIWREAYNLAGSMERFEAAFAIWREQLSTVAADPRTVVAFLNHTMESQ